MRDYRPADPLADVARSRRTRVSIELLGGFRVVLSSGGLPDSAWMQRRAARALIKLLAAEPDHKLHREQILEYVWPGMEGRSALNSFSKALHAARRALEPDLPARAASSFLQLSQDVLSLNTENAWIDVDQFQRLADIALEQGEVSAFEAALAAYSGELLPEDRYEDWTLSRRDALANVYLRLLLGLADVLERQGAYTHAIQVLRQVLDQEPTREDVSRRLMRLLAEAGSRHEALRQYQVCQAVLRRDLDVDPEPETEELYKAILANRIHHRLDDSKLTPDDSPISPVQAIWTSLSTPMVGRERVLERLLGELERAEEGDGGMVLISGEAGVGKTRLQAELTNRAAHRGVLVLWGSAGHENTVPYGPFAVGLEGYVSGRPPAEREELARRYPDLIRLVPSLDVDGQVLSLPTTSDDDRSRLFPAIIRFLTDLSSTRGVILALGDLHAADFATLQLLHYLARLAIQRRWLLVGTYREEDVAPGSEFQRLLTTTVKERFCRQIELRPLARHDCARLVQALLPDGVAEDALAEQIYALSLGNPLFVEELIWAMRDRHEISLIQGRWCLTSSASIRVPRQVRNLVELNVARLDEQVRRVLVLAAAAGPEFTFAELRVGADALHPPLSQGFLFEALDRALGARILQETEEGYAFRHPLVRAALADHESKQHHAKLRAAFSTTERPDRHIPEQGMKVNDLVAPNHPDFESPSPQQVARMYGEMVDRLEVEGGTLDSAEARQKLAAALTGMGRYGRALQVLSPAIDTYQSAGDHQALKRVYSQIELITFLQGGHQSCASPLVSPLGFPSADAS